MAAGVALHVLLVEDDLGLRQMLEPHLAAEPGWIVRAVGDGEAALGACETSLPDLVVLDVMLPGRSGLEVCALLRALYHPSPGVLMLTARADELDIILGFEVGADDYVLKPCRPREVVARLKALARRVRPPSRDAPEAVAPPSPVLVRGALAIDVGAQKVSVGERALKLTQTELAMLIELAREPEIVHTRASLLERVFETKHEGYARNVDCHVARLRRKLDAAGLVPCPIETVHGAGYRFVEAR
jgi:DNA-binding response OmpR family regulator